MLNPQDQEKTETFHFPKLSRPRRDETFNLQDRDETETFQKTSRLQCRSLKTLTGEVCHLTTCFLWVRSIIFLLIHLQAWCIAWMFTRPKVMKPETLYLRDRDETETLNPQDRDETETFDFSKLSRLRHSTFKTETLQKTSRDCLETEMFKTKTTSMLVDAA